MENKVIKIADKAIDGYNNINKIYSNEPNNGKKLKSTIQHCKDHYNTGTNFFNLRNEDAKIYIVVVL